MALALLDVVRASINARSTYSDGAEEVALLDELRDRKLSVEPEMTEFRALCARWDNLYYPQGFTPGGASHWATHASAWTPGQSHVSLNVYPSYVDIPASLQSVVPIENMLANDITPQARQVASMAERLYMAWKREERWDIQFHQAAIVKSLYGRTAGKVWWDDATDRPKIEIIDQPQNLYLGWGSSNYKRLDWAIYCYAITPSTALEDWGVLVEERHDKDGKPFAYVSFPSELNSRAVPLASADLRVEVYDYWYRQPKPGTEIIPGKPTKFETWNAVFVGNVMVANLPHPEYDGLMPYVPLFNTYIPGVPMGRPELLDIEQIIREKDEKISEMSQMMSRAIKGQYWQLTGAEADSVSPDLKPIPNKVIAPGAGNRIEAIQPWMPEFQAEQYLSRMDREAVEVSGLNDLLRGVAPTGTMNSGKAISALVANYETRVMMKRAVFYLWRNDMWNTVRTVWGNKRTQLKPILTAAYLDIQPPSLTPRDDAETAQIAASMKENKLWSAVRAMDKVGVDDPEAEQDVIRAEQTDATLNPAAVQVMLTLMATAQQLGVQMQQLQQQAAAAGAPQAGPGPATMEQNANTMRQLAPQEGMAQPQLNAPEAQPVTPGEQMPGNTPAGAAAGAAGPSQMLNQFQVQGGEATTRIVGQQTVQKSGQ